MPDDAVIEHEPGTVGRQENRRIRIPKSREIEERPVTETVKQSHQNNYNGNVTLIEPNLSNESRWPCLAFDNAGIYQSRN